MSECREHDDTHDGRGGTDPTSGRSVKLTKSHVHFHRVQRKSAPHNDEFNSPKMYSVVHISLSEAA